MTNATPNSLMRRTKAELVNIILRKDETEAKAAEEIKKLNKEVSNYEVSYKKKVDEFNKIKEVNDDNQVFISKLIETNKKLKNTLIYSCVAFSAIIIMYVIVTC